MKTRLGVKDILFPVPAALIVSGTFDEPNITVVAWIGIMGSDPPVIGISLKNDRYTLELIRSTKDFSVNIPKADDFAQVDYCGMVSGRKRNRLKDIHFTVFESNLIKAPIINECPFNIECKLINQMDIGKWVLLLGEIVETHIDSDKVTNENPAGIDISKADPLVYCATVREYWRLGEKVGNAFSSGKTFLTMDHTNE